MDAPTFILKQAATSATPLLIAGYGELLAQRAGVLNVGIEGTMLLGAITAFAAAVLTGSAAAAIPAALAIGLLMGALFALVSVWFKTDQVVAGTALNILAFGASTTAWRALQSSMDTHPTPPLFDPVPLPILSNIPLLGPALFNQFPLFYLSILLAALLAFALPRTRTGLIIKALGDNPDACDAAGIRVRLARTALLLLAGSLAGLAGAYLSTMRGHTFQLNMTDGRGFLVLALVIFGRWSIPGFLLGTLAFSALDALQSLLAASPDATSKIPHQFFDLLPYAATLLALAFLSRSRAGPLHLGRPWPS